METQTTDAQNQDQRQITLSPPQELFPETKEEVCEIVKAAAEQHVGLIPVSSQTKHSWEPEVEPGDNKVVVNFTKMNKIVRIDGPSRSAWIEPGVTFGQLIPALAEQGLRLNMPLCPPAGKSVVTSMLEREPIVIPKYQYDYIDPLLTMEIVYGNGETMRTGSASGPGTLETLKSDKVCPWGPGCFDFGRFVSGAQGTMGFLVWGVAKLEIAPKLRKTFFVAADEAGALVDLSNELLRYRVPDECLIMSALQMSKLFGGAAADYPAWTMIVCVCGFDHYPEDRVRIYEGYLRKMCTEANLECLEALPSGIVSAEKVAQTITNCMPEQAAEALNSARKIFFLCTMSNVARYVEAMKAEAEKLGFPAEQIGTYIQPIVQGRGVYVEFSLFASDDQAALRDELFTAASKALFDQGAYFDRPYGEWNDMVYANCPDAVGAMRKLKKIYDPLNILNPDQLCFGGM